MAYKKPTTDKLLLQIRLNENRVAKYIVARDGKVERFNESDVESATHDCNAIVSYTEDDFYLKTSTKLSDNKLSTQFVLKAEASPNCKIINHSLSGFAYGTPNTRFELSDKKLSVYPLLELLNLNLSGKDNYDVAGFLIGNNNEILILTCYDEDGEIVLSVSADVDDIKSQMDNFAMASKVRDDYKHIIFDHNEFFSILEQAVPYPNYASFYGIKADVIWAGLIALSVGGLLLMGSTYLYQQNKINSLKKNVANITLEKDELIAKTAEIASSHIPNIIKASTVDFNAFFLNAESLWSEPSYLESNVLKNVESHTLHLDISNTSKTTNYQINNFYEVNLPTNCLLENTKIKGNLNEITTKYNCSNPNSDFVDFGI